MTFNEILESGVVKHRQNGSFEHLITEYVQRIGDDITLGYIGANTGQELPFLRTITKKIYAFEPINTPSVWGELIRHQDANVTCINVALSDKNEDDVLMYPSSNNFESSSLLAPNLHLSEFPWVHFGEPIKVNARRLDSYPFHQELNVLCMDVQGAEYKVLKGISDFSNIKLIVLEYGIPDSYSGGCSFEEINNLLTSAGFTYQESFGHHYNGNTNAYFSNAIFLRNNI
jgi:FkbM family methyltransferase